MPIRHTASVALASLSLLGVVAGYAQAQAITIGTATSANGNPFGHGPAASYPTEYQELYNPADFAGPFSISSIGFASAVGGSGPASFDATISFSTTSTPYNSPSTTFASNEGLNVQAVFNGTLDATLQENGTFDLVFPTKTYVYDPSQGTLLLDIVVHSTPHLPTPTFFETDDTGSDFTRVWNSFGTNTTDPNGMVTRFGGSPVPESSTMVSLALLLCLGSGGLLLKGRRRKVQNRQ